MPNSAFCLYHKKNGCRRISPPSGYEPPYEPSRWNKKQEIRETHNCFAYAMNINDPKQITDCKKNKDCDVPFHQPGSASGHNGFTSTRDKSCSEMIARILGDNPGIRMSTFTAQCPPETSKIAIVVDPKEDYHFYRYDDKGQIINQTGGSVTPDVDFEEGHWSHKPGGTEVTNKDSTGHLIYDPKLANRDYRKNGGRLHYNVFCSYLCVPRTRILHLKVGGGKYQVTRSQKRRSRRGVSSASFSQTARRKRTD